MAFNWNHFFSDPIQNGVKEYLYNLIGAERFFPHEGTVEQIARTFNKQSDYEGFSSLMAAIYEAGYVRAIDEHTAELKKLGLKVNIKKIQKEESGPPIFNQKNPSGPR